MPEDGGLINQALIGLKPVNAWVHTYTKSQTPSTRSRGLGRRIHESVEDTKLSTNKQHTLKKERERERVRDANGTLSVERAVNIGALTLQMLIRYVVSFDRY